MLCLLYLLNQTAGRAQGLPYNLNISNGLPSNHVYMSVVDRLGYLWIATPKGVIRYNGYETKLFDVNNGLPIDDVWYLLEDKAGRMWLSGISNELGYIQDNRYRTAYKNGDSIFAPRGMVHYKNGIAVLNHYSSSLNKKGAQWEIVLLSNKQQIKRIGPIYADNLLLAESLDVVTDSSNVFFAGPITEKGIAFSPAIAWNRKNGKMPLGRFSQLMGGDVFIANKNADHFQCFDWRAGKLKGIVYPFSNKGEKIICGYNRDDKYTIISTGYVYVYDQSLRLEFRSSLASLVGKEWLHTDNPAIFFDYPLWGHTLGTRGNGIYISNRNAPFFMPAGDLELRDYTFIAYLGPDRGLWWHAGKQLLKVIYKGAAIETIKTANINELKAAQYMGNDSLLLFSDKGTIWLSLAVTRPSKYVAGNIITSSSSYLTQLSDAVAISSDSIYLLSVGSHRTFFSLIQNRYKNLLDTYFDKMTFDKFRYGFWLYRNQMAAFYDIRKRTFRFFYPNQLRKLGVRKIDDIAVDEKFGNVFIKGHDRLYLLNDDFSAVKPLYTNHRIENAQLQIQNGKLVLAGRCGVLYSRITGIQKLEPVQWHENFKDIHYSQVYDLQLLDTIAILNTDKGAYRVSLNGSRQIDYEEQVAPCRFIAYTADTTQRIQAYDTLWLPPGTLSVQWDVINPKGTGKLELAYKVDKKDSAWQALPGAQLNTASLQPDHLYHLEIKASDEIWRSAILPVYLYKKPYWWQTTRFLLLLVLAGVFIFLLAILITRRIILNNQLQKQRIMEMGLAGIHAQINPHFVFNSLSIAQFFIKTNKVQEAYAHINRFSKLLRNFLYASRHKYITIGEEIVHLGNYIELQQTRFAEPFDYAITLSPEVDPGLHIPSLLLQPLVENAIQHGLFNRKTKGTLSLVFELEDKKLAITIADNGIGRGEAKKLRQDNGKKESYGNDLIQKLIFIFNKYERIKIELSYHDKQGPETGTVVKILISYPFL